MTTALVSKQFVASFGDALKAVAERAGKSVEFMTLPEEQGARLSQADCDRIDCTFLGSRHPLQRPASTRLTATRSIASKSRKWIHVISSGVNPHAVYRGARPRAARRSRARRASNAEPVAQTGFHGAAHARARISRLRHEPAASTNGGRARRRAARRPARPDACVLIGVGAVGRPSPAMRALSGSR